MTRSIDEGQVRTDRDPTASRFPELGSFVEARWMGGRLGDDRVPGPSTYFIEAVVTLAPADVERLRTAHGFQPTTPPQIPGALRGPSGPWSSSPELDAELGPQGWVSRVWVDLPAGVAYVSARGG